MKEYELKIVNTENDIRIEVSGDVTIATSEKIASELLRSLLSAGNGTLDLTNATTIDVVGIQLAYAWKKAFAHKQRKAIVILPQSENIKDLFVKTGITQIL
jgi:hypothetical protein